ncbi:MAG: hypothetical protein WC758_01475 [Candidatus Woesearchaeota archaeon]|jgi:hypothetical protein
MSLNNKLVQIGIYTLAKTAKEQNLNYLLVGGLNVQVIAYPQFKEYLRPTIDADILIETIPFKQFATTYGHTIGQTLKNKFNLGYHLQNNHFANTATLIENTPDLQSKQVFILSFTRHQDGLYEKINDQVKNEITTCGTSIPLCYLGIQEDSIHKKAKITDCECLTLNSRIPEKEIQVKIQRMQKKLNLPANIGKDFEKIRHDALSNSSAQIPTSLSNLYEQIMMDFSNETTYNVTKDIYDYALLKKSIS